MTNLLLKIYKNFVEVTIISDKKIILEEKIEDDSNSIEKKLSDIISEYKPTYSSIFPYILNLSSKLVNVNNISLYNSMLLKKHIKKVEQELGNKIFNIKPLKISNEKCFVVKNISISELSNSILEYIKAQDIVVKQINFWQISNSKNLIRKNNLSGWNFIITKNQNDISITVTLDSDIILLREINSSNENIAFEITQTLQYIKTFGYDDNNLSILLDGGIEQEIQKLFFDIKTNLNCKLELFETNNDLEKNINIYNIEKPFLISQLFKYLSFFVFLLFSLISIKNYIQIKNEKQKQQQIISNLKSNIKLPLNEKELNKIQDDSVDIKTTIEIINYKNNLKNFLEFHGLYKMFISQIHKGNFLINLDFKRFNNSRSKKIFSLNSVFSPTIFYKDSFNKSQTKNLLEKEIRTANKKIQNILKGKNIFAANIKPKGKKEFNLSLEMLIKKSQKEHIAYKNISKHKTINCLLKKYSR